MNSTTILIDMTVWQFWFFLYHEKKFSCFFKLRTMNICIQTQLWDITTFCCICQLQRVRCLKLYFRSSEFISCKQLSLAIISPQTTEWHQGYCLHFSGLNTNGFTEKQNVYRSQIAPFCPSESSGNRLWAVNDQICVVLVTESSKVQRSASDSAAVCVGFSTRSIKKCQSNAPLWWAPPPHQDMFPITNWIHDLWATAVVLLTLKLFEKKNNKTPNFSDWKLWNQQVVSYLSC